MADASVIERVTVALAGRPSGSRRDAPGGILPSRCHPRRDVFLLLALRRVQAVIAPLVVVAMSKTPVSQWFGPLIAFAAVGSLTGALLMIPRFFALFKRQEKFP
jgi:hypothetical protein